MIYCVSHHDFQLWVVVETLLILDNLNTKIFLKILATNTKKKKKICVSSVPHCIVHSLYSGQPTLSLASHFRLVSEVLSCVLALDLGSLWAQQTHTCPLAPVLQETMDWQGEASPQTKRRVWQRKWHLHYANDIIESDGSGGRQTVK